MQTWGISTLGPRLYTKRGLESLFWAQLTLKTTRRTRRTARARASTTRTSWLKSVGKAQTRWVPLLWRFTAHLRQPGRHSATRTLPSLVASVAIGATRDWQDSGTCAGRSQAVQLIRPDGESGDLDMDVEQLQVRDIGCYPSTKAVTETLFAHWTPILALALVHLIRAMRTGGRRLDFLGLTGTMLSDGAASMIAGALNTLRARDPASGAETVEILQVALEEPARRQLQTAGERAGVKVLLSRANGPALRTCSQIAADTAWQSHSSGEGCSKIWY